MSSTVVNVDVVRVGFPPIYIMHSITLALLGKRQSTRCNVILLTLLHLLLRNGLLRGCSGTTPRVLASTFWSVRSRQPSVSPSFNPVFSSIVRISVATLLENVSRPFWVASLTRSKVIALCCFAISCVPANMGNCFSSSSPRYVDTLCIAWTQRGIPISSK